MLFQAWHGNLRSDSVLVHTGYMGTGAVLVNNNKNNFLPAFINIECVQKHI